MTGRIISDIILYGYVGLGALSGLFGAVALRSGYCHRPAPGRLVFRRPWAQCACLGLMGLCFLLLPLLMASDDLSLYGVVPRRHWLLLGGFAWIGLMGSILILWVGQPRVLELDEGRRTYRWAEGWPPFRRIRTGAWSDLAGVYAQELGTYGRNSMVGILRRGGGDWMEIGRFGPLLGAERAADELASRLNLPRVPPPGPFQAG